MVSIQQQRDMNRQILSVSGNEGSKAKAHGDFREQMLLHNHIDGVLKFEIVHEDNEKVYEYDIDGKYTFAEYFSKYKPDRDNIIHVMRDLLEIIFRSREYMLSENDYIISPENVFLDEEGRVYTAYYPGYGEDMKFQLRDLAEYLMGVVDYSDEAAVLMVYGFYMKTKDNNCTLEDLMRCLSHKQEEVLHNGRADTESIEKDEKDLLISTKSNTLEPAKNTSFCSLPATREEQHKVLYHKVSEAPGENYRLREVLKGEDDFQELRSEEEAVGEINPVKVFIQSPKIMKVTGLLLPVAALIILFGLLRTGLLINSSTGKADVIKTIFFVLVLFGGCFEAEKLMWKSFSGKLRKKLASAAREKEEATVFLYGNDSAGYPFSLVSDDQPAINVSHFPFFVGKDARHCDYVMTSQVGISRYHMKIDKEGEDFTISDLNSTNGTYINGERLAPHLPKRVHRGDELRIGKCIYYCN